MSTQLRSYKYRLYPDAAQTATLAQFFGAKRWIYNHFLSEQKRRFEAKEKHLSAFDCNIEITKLKQQSETSWLKSIDDWCLKTSAEDLATGYKNFFDSIKGKRKGPKVETPKYKSKYDNRQSYRTRGVKVNFEKNQVSLSKIKCIKTAIDRSFVGEIKYATVSKTPSGKYFVSILVEEQIKLKSATGAEVGCDLGLKDLLILSNGVKFAHPEKMLARTKQALKRQQRKFARTKSKSKNRTKARIKVAKLYEKLTNMRNAYYHNISSYLINNFDAIYLENLNVAGMIKHPTLARKIHESAWSTLASMIQYKAGFYGKTYHKIDRFAPSSKTCSCCGHKLAKLDLSVREWTCPTCGTEHDRDLNAAINIKNFGQIDLYDHTISSVESIEVGLNIPATLMKYASKIERSNGNIGLHRDGVRTHKVDLIV